MSWWKNRSRALSFVCEVSCTGSFINHEISPLLSYTSSPRRPGGLSQCHQQPKITPPPVHPFLLPLVMESSPGFLAATDMAQATGRRHSNGHSEGTEALALTSRTPLWQQLSGEASGPQGEKG